MPGRSKQPTPLRRTAAQAGRRTRTAAKTRVVAKPRPGALDRCVTVADFEAIASRRMAPSHFGYYAGGAEDERTLARNRGAFDHYALLPRVLVDVSEILTATTLLGAPVSMPIALAPAAFHRLACAEGETATARAAGAAGALMCASTYSTRPLEEIAAAAGGPLWFQLYVTKDRSVTERLVVRAEQAGYRALVLTVDTPRLGRRERDLRNGFELPKNLSMANFVSEVKRPGRWSAHETMLAYANSDLDPSLTWEAVEWLRGITSLPIVLKGILRADDAARAVQAGVAGVWVSNHGGRQLDGAEATILALPEVVESVGGRAEVYVDGGFRRGADVLKALALGARAAFIGRPYLWGLAAGGEQGAARVIEMLRAELETAMALAGAPDLAAIDRSLVAASRV